MSLNKHTAVNEAESETASQERRQSSPIGADCGTVSQKNRRMTSFTITLPVDLNWEFREIAARKQTTRPRLMLQVIEDFVRENKGAAA